MLADDCRAVDGMVDQFQEFVNSHCCNSFLIGFSMTTLTKETPLSDYERCELSTCLAMAHPKTLFSGKTLQSKCIALGFTAIQQHCFTFLSYLGLFEHHQGATKPQSRPREGLVGSWFSRIDPDKYGY